MDQDQNMLDYVELFKSGSDPKSFFKLFRKPVVVEHEAKHAQWFCCVLWDDVARKEFQNHEEMKGTLQTKMFLGRMLRNRIKDSLDGMAEQMKWKQPFVLVDVIGDKFGMCGINKCLRVRETPTWNTGGGNGSNGFHELKTWDLVMFPECLELAEEMIRPEYSGVKKTVCIWNADLSPYPEPWIDGVGAQVSGEIFLRPTRKIDEKILTVIIFYHGGVGNFEGVPVPNIMAAEEDKIVKLYSESFHHREWMMAKLYPNPIPKDYKVSGETAEKSAISCSSLNDEIGNDIERRNDEESVPIPVMRDIVEQLPVNNLEPLKDKLKKLRSARMASKLDEIKSGSLAAQPVKVSGKHIRTGDGEYECLSSSSPSVVTSDDEDDIAGIVNRGQEDAVMIIDETDYEKSDTESDAMSVDVMKEANQDIRQLAEYFLACRK